MGKSVTRQRRSKKQAESRSQNMIIAGIAAVGVIAVAVVIFFINRSQLPEVDLAAVEDASVTFPLQGQEHIPEGSPRPNYNSNPPTSGPHYATPIRAGIYHQVVPDELLVHNLEHGHIWMTYRDPEDTEAIEALTRIQNAFPQWSVVTHRPDNDDRIAAAAWGRLLTLEEPDEDQLLAFITRHRNRAPESIPG